MKNNYTLYGANQNFLFSTKSQVVLSGSYQSGKTTAIWKKIDLICRECPNSRILVTRQTSESLEALLSTYENRYLYDTTSNIEKRGSHTKKYYTYPNGSMIISSPLLNGEEMPSHLMASEFDLAYVAHIEEVREDQWEMICSRTTGRAANVPYAQVIGEFSGINGYRDEKYDAHWIHYRKGLTIFDINHKDNPALFNHEKQIFTEHGEKTIEILSGLKDFRYEREIEGIWQTINEQ